MPEIVRTKGELLVLRGSDEPDLIEDLFRQSMTQARAHGALLLGAICGGEPGFGAAEHREGKGRRLQYSLPYTNVLLKGFPCAKLKEANGAIGPAEALIQLAHSVAIHIWMSADPGFSEKDYALQCAPKQASSLAGHYARIGRVAWYRLNRKSVGAPFRQ